jgi:hypothetical protein
MLAPPLSKDKGLLLNKLVVNQNSRLYWMPSSAELSW